MGDKQIQYHNPVILFLSVPLVLLLIFTSSIGYFSIDFYVRETINWQVQCVGQDMIDLFVVVPVLICSAIFAWNGNKIGLLLWGGTNLYLVYTFCIYCFAVHFNSLFISYCINLGLAFYSLMYFIYLQIKKPILNLPSNSTWIKIIGIYFIVLAILFYALWLSEIIPAIRHQTTPASIVEAGLLTNAVHVIDLAVFLPGLLITGILLLKRHYVGFILAPVCLLFFILMDITIGGLIVLMYQKGLEVQLPVAFGMAGLAIVSAVLLFWYCLEMVRNNYFQ